VRECQNARLPDCRRVQNEASCHSLTVAKVCACKGRLPLFVCVNDGIVPKSDNGRGSCVQRTVSVFGVCKRRQCASDSGKGMSVQRTASIFLSTIIYLVQEARPVSPKTRNHIHKQIRTHTDMHPYIHIFMYLHTRTHL
jgi:hypothetical protein